MIKYEGTPPQSSRHPSVELNPRLAEINNDKLPDQALSESSTVPENRMDFAPEEVGNESTVEDPVNLEVPESDESTSGPAESAVLESAEQKPEEVNEVTLEKPLPSVDSLHVELQNIMKAETLENPNEIIDPKAQLESLALSFKEIEGRIAELRKVVEEKTGAIDKLRSFLGMDKGEPLNEEKEIERLESKKKELEVFQEEAEDLDALQEVMDSFQDISPEDLEHIKEHGTMPNGEPVRTKGGKMVEEDVAKEIADAVQSGVKFLTRLILKTTLAVVGGILSGIFSVAKDVGGSLI